LRKNEALSLRLGDIDLDRRTVIPRKGYDGAKNTWVTFLNEEAAQLGRLQGSSVWGESKDALLRGKGKRAAPTRMCRCV